MTLLFLILLTNAVQTVSLPYQACRDFAVVTATNQVRLEALNAAGAVLGIGTNVVELPPTTARVRCTGGAGVELRVMAVEPKLVIQLVGAAVARKLKADNPDTITIFPVVEKNGVVASRYIVVSWNNPGMCGGLEFSEDLVNYTPAAGGPYRAEAFFRSHRYLVPQ